MSGAPSLAAVLGQGKSFAYGPAQAWTSAHWPVCAAAATLYVAGVLAGPKLMKGRPAMDLKPALVLWNAALAVFSWLGLPSSFPPQRRRHVEF